MTALENLSTSGLSEKAPVTNNELVGRGFAFGGICKTDQPPRSPTGNEIFLEGSLARFTGESEPVLWMKRFLQKVAPLEVNVLIAGPSGSGKELAAEIIHSLSNRSRKPFIKIDCSSISEGTLELAIFGAEKDPSMGTMQDVFERIEAANGGTVLFDEIGDMPLKVQRRLLRFSEHKETERLGRKDLTSLDVRILATTNRDLAALIRQGGFREDLFYRLNEVFIQVPPLRDRLEDLPELIRTLMRGINSKLGTRVADISNAALSVLSSHDWPGNVRELRNILERAAILSDGSVINEQGVRMALREAFGGLQPKRLDPEQAEIMKGVGSSLKEVMHKIEKKLILEALCKTSGVQAEAAEILGVNPKNLWKKIQKHSIKVDQLTA